MNTHKIETEHAPKAVGPYSQAINVKGASEFVFVSGQLPVNPLTGKLVETDITAATNQVFDNIEAILRASGCSFHNVVRVEVFMKDLADFQKMNEVYLSRFSNMTYPARQTIQVAKLPLDAPIEISCIAVL